MRMIRSARSKSHLPAGRLNEGGASRRVAPIPVDACVDLYARRVGRRRRAKSDSYIG